MNIWAHRGCSQCYPENTLLSFEKAAALLDKGLCGIELDVQLTSDGVPVVIHDERIDRTTDGFGFVRDYKLSELKTFHIHTGNKEPEYIPSFEEVLELLKEPMKKGLMLNIELKNSIYPYPGLEEKVIDMVRAFGLRDSVIYSSFYAASLNMVREMEPEAEIGILDVKVSDCLYKLKGGCGANDLHPAGGGMDLPKEMLSGYKVRAWFAGHLYPEKPGNGRMDMKAMEERGITDVFINEPEKYL